ncbi:hypothetical protein [Shewanella xiamenensis]|uniref:hypothetical protein n=1 Tax=Shewanella xiamenensis TaxID=332186 RepID=UPI001184F03C|nr:hypothetical protein [Shewanella xiamenensis]TVL32899.1 hypothetical protein AYI95_08220 [Shewanella xiamenensis]
MSKNRTITPPDFLKLFDFLISETETERIWMTNYISKKGIPTPDVFTSTDNLKLHLLAFFTQNATDAANIKLTAAEMRNAWRVRKHRQSKGVVSLSISLDKTIAAKLAQMCKDQTQAEVITQLITGNYKEFLTQKNELKTKLAEEKVILKARQVSAKFEKMENNLTISTQQPTPPSDNDLAQTEELRNGIASLYDLIFTTHEQGGKVDDKLLLQATKIYYDTFAR